MNFIYNYNKPDYNTIIKKSIKIKKDYLKEKEALTNNYKNILMNFNCHKYQKLMLAKKRMDLKYILKIIAIFKPVLKNNVFIFIHGSYSRNLNRWNSDIDLNILYKNDVKKQYIVVEEFINALIYQMLGFKGRDRVHNIMLYYPLCENTKYDISGNKHKIICSNQIFNFCCRDNYNHIYPLILNSSRNPSDLYNWILEEKHNDENQYSFQGLNFKGKTFVNKLTYDKSTQQTKDSLKQLINQTLDDIQSVSILQRYMLISDLNKIIKIKNFHIINNFLLCLKEYIFLQMRKKTSNNLDFYKIIHHRLIHQKLLSEKLRELEYLITKYRFIIDRIENLFLELGINFSSRENKKIDMQTINKKYEKKYYQTFTDDYEIIFNIYENITAVLKQIDNDIKSLSKVYNITFYI